MNTDLLLPLEFLRPGECADVADVTGEPGWVGRMAELGLRAGCRLRLLRGGSPCLLEIDGCRLCLRGDCLAQILVRPVAAVA
ncbi:MAG TPA: FeoA family protein [Gemmataceae bacterium]|nr:FeoA family protein [Gemmataceae bacterium]